MAFALLPSSAHTCFRPRSAPVLVSGRRQQPSAACQSYRDRSGRGNGFSGPGMFGVGMGGPWGPFINGLGDKTIAQLLQDLEREMQRVNTEAGRPGRRSPFTGPAQAASGHLPLAVDTVETDDAITFYADVPGLLKSDLKIRINQQERMLTVSGERAKPEAVSESATDDGRASWERLYGPFKRELSLPESADLQAISAKVDKGVLRVRVLKEIKRARASEQEIQID